MFPTIRLLNLRSSKPYFVLEGERTIKPKLVKECENRFPGFLHEARKEGTM